MSTERTPTSSDPVGHSAQCLRSTQLADSAQTAWRATTHGTLAASIAWRDFEIATHAEHAARQNCPGHRIGHARVSAPDSARDAA